MLLVASGSGHEGAGIVGPVESDFGNSRVTRDDHFQILGEIGARLWYYGFAIHFGKINRDDGVILPRIAFGLRMRFKNARSKLLTMRAPPCKAFNDNATLGIVKFFFDLI